MHCRSDNGRCVVAAMNKLRENMTKRFAAADENKEEEISFSLADRTVSIAYFCHVCL